MRGSGTPEAPCDPSLTRLIWGLCFSFWGSSPWVYGSGFGVQGLGLRVEGLGF